MNPARWTFLDNVNWVALARHEAEFADLPTIGTLPLDRSA